MKRLITCAVMVLFISALAVSVFAAEGDFGFYDRDFDGVVEVTDALGVLKDVVNNDNGTSLLHFIRTLRVTVNGVSVKLPIGNFDYDDKTVTLYYSKGGETYPLVMSFSQLGLDRVPSITCYEEGYVTLTVPAPAEDYLKNFDVKNVYAVKLESRYVQDVLECTADSKIAKINGVETELSYSAPTMREGLFMINASGIRDFFEAYTTWNDVTKTVSYTVLDNTLEMVLDSAEAMLNGEKIVAPAPLVYIGSHLYVPAEFVVEALGGTAVFDDATNTMTISKYSYPTLYIDNVPTVSAGEEFVVTVNLRHNPGVAGFQYYIDYNSNAMSYVSGKGTISNMFSQVSPNAASNPVKFVAANLSLKNVSGDLATAEITFKVADNATPGTYTLAFSNFEAYAYDGEILPVKAFTTTACVTIK